MPDLQKEIAKANAHDAYPRAVHKSMELTFNMRFRPNLTSPLTVSEGRQIKEQNAALDQKRTEGEKLRRRRRTLAAKTGVPLAAMGDSDEAIKGAEMELEGMRELGLDAESPGDKS